MKNVAIVALLVLSLVLVGCSTPKGEITIINDGNTITYRETRNGKPSPHSIKVEKDSTIVSLDYGKPEPPTLPQLCEYSQAIFDQTIKPKLESGETLSNEELVILACCMNVRISMIKALNGTVLASMDLPLAASLTFGIVAHPNLPSMLEVPKKRYAKIESNRLDAEKAFNEKLKGLSNDFINDRPPAIETWGQSFSGDDSFTLGLDERRRLLEHMLKNEGEPFKTDYLRRGSWLWLWLIPATNSSNNELPDFQETYRQRIRNTKWKTGNFGYDTNILALTEMYSDITNGIHIAGISTEKNQQYDRLRDLENQFSKFIQDSISSQYLVEDYPFAVMLLESMKMMGWYYKREWVNHTRSRVQRKYKTVAKNLCLFSKAMNIQKLHNQTLIALYENEYVKFLGKSLNKTSEELYLEGLIPFLPKGAK